jgi:Tol biopolymer transport system component
MTRGPWIRCLALTIVLAAASSAAADTFEVVTNDRTIGQAPVWDVNDPEYVIFNKDLGQGFQIYRSRLADDGSEPVCLTCGPGATKPPNQVPVMRPQGDKILYHSWNGRVFTVGAPGFGGLGSQIYVMDPDGSDVVQLTEDVDNGEGQDNFHAYWSPDGNRIVWTHIHWNFVTSDGRGLWDVRVADYVDDATGPHLENMAIVRPDNGHFYETQWWAPDGSGFLYTESVGSSLDLELFFCHLSDPPPPELPECTAIDRLTDDTAWDEQAIFTPDGSRVIFMSTRDHPGFFNSYADAGAAAGIPAETDYLTVLPVFAAGFLQPIAPEATDLWEIDLATPGHDLRRLTFDGDDGWIIPEFAWSPDGKKLLWTEQKYPDGLRVPLPLDPARQAGETVGFVEDPTVPNVNPAHPGINGAVVARTRIGSYVSP